MISEKNIFNFIVNPDVIFKTDYSGDNIFIIFLNDENYYFKIDGLAAKIWMIIDSKTTSPIKTDDLYNECLKLFMPPEDKFKSDFENYLTRLLDEKLIFKQ